MFRILLIFLITFISPTFAVSVAEECIVWERITEQLKTGNHGVWETTCWRNIDCTGFNCIRLSEQTDAERSDFDFYPLDFGVTILPCSYPLSMNIHLYQSNAPNFTKQMTINSAGNVHYELGSVKSDVVRRIEVVWSSVLRPIRYKVELEVNYTIYQKSTNVNTPLTVARRVSLVPRVVVPVPDCKDLYQRAELKKEYFSTTTPRSSVKQGFDKPDSHTAFDMDIMPLAVGIGLIILFLALLGCVLVCRHWAAWYRSRSPNKHHRLINEYEPEGHMLQV